MFHKNKFKEYINFFKNENIKVLKVKDNKTPKLIITKKRRILNLSLKNIGRVLLTSIYTKLE